MVAIWSLPDTIERIGMRAYVTIGCNLSEVQIYRYLAIKPNLQNCQEL